MGSARTKALPRSRNSTRDRERAELAALRQLSQELEVHVSALRHQHQQQTPLSLAVSAAPSTSRAFVVHTWRRLAERQYRARCDATQMNRQLSDRVQNNADWIERLWKLLLERRRTHAAANARAIATLQSKYEDALLFERLKSEVHAAAERSDDVFAAHGIYALGRAGTIVDAQEPDRWLHESTGDCSSLIVCTRWVPFDTHSTSATVWRALSTLQDCAPHTNDAIARTEVVQTWRVIEQTHDVCTLRFRERVTLPTRTEPVLLHYHAFVYQVPQRDVRAPRVFVWHAVCVSDADDIVEHNDLMWLAVERAPSSSLVSRVAIVSQSRMTSGPLADGAMWRTALMPLVEACVDVILSLLDNALLDETIRESTKSSPMAAACEVTAQATV